MLKSGVHPGSTCASLSSSTAAATLTSTSAATSGSGSIADVVTTTGSTAGAWISPGDVPAPPGEQDFFGLHTGLLTLAGKRKPAYDAFVSTAREIER